MDKIRSSLGRLSRPRNRTQDSASEKSSQSISSDVQAEAAGDSIEYPSGFKLFIILISATLVAFLMLLDTSIVATAIPQITSEFHALDDVGWYSSAYLLASCSLQPLTGKLYSHFSPKWTFLIFVGIFELGSLLCGVAVDSKMFIVGRAVAGMGASGILNGALTIVSNCLPMHRRPVFLGALIGVAQLGLVVGPLVGGAFTQYVTWRWCFYVNLPAGGAVALLLFLIDIPSRVPKLEKSLVLSVLAKKLDLIGFALFAPATIQCLLALEWGGTRYPWNSATIIGLFVGAGGTLIVYGLWEHRVGSSAMIPLATIRQQIVWSSCLATFFSFGTSMTTVYYLPLWFQSVKGVSPTKSGVWLLPTIISMIFSAVISGALVGRLGYYLPWMVASGVLTAIGSGLFTLFTPSTPTGKWLGFQILNGVGRGMAMQMPIVAVQNALPAEMVSIGTALVVFAQSFGGALFLATGETDFASSLVKALPRHAPNVSAQTVLVAGATAFRDIVPKQELAGVVQAYNDAIVNTFYLATGGAAAVFFFAWGMGWKSVKKAKKTSTPPSETVETKTKEEV